MNRALGAILAVPIILATSGTAMATGKPIVTFKTNMGDFTVQLEPEKTPKTVNNFLKYVRDGHYDGTIFHRVIAKFMVQGGGFLPNLQKKDTRGPITNEADNGLKNERGTIAMARTADPHSATAQFFVNVIYNRFLDHTAKTQQGWGYTAFGRVIDGMNIVGRMARVKTGKKGPYSDVPNDPIIIEKAIITSE
tara:strand:- start:154 stop:732 length:579 start_codon:yes stop_codon:yes gene_type:complete